MSLAILLLLGSFFLFVYLDALLTRGNISQFELEVALTLNVEGAQAYQLSTVQVGTSRWVQLIKKLSVTDGEKSVRLARYYEKNNEWRSSIRWYKHAISLNYQPAIHALSTLYVHQGKLNKARDILNNYGKQAPEFLVDEIEVAIAQGDTAFVKKYYAELIEQSSHNVLIKNLLNKIKRYQIIDSQKSDSFEQGKMARADDSCDVKIQMFATSIADLEAIHLLNQQFNQQPLNEFVCLTSPYYISIRELSCHHNNNEAIACDESIWQNQKIDDDTRFIAVLHPRGGANVHLGLLYFDRTDSIDVFAHEISHLLGFIDEYPLPESHPFCLSEDNDSANNQASHNIVRFKQVYKGNRQTIREGLLDSIAWADKIKETTPILYKEHNNAIVKHGSNSTQLTNKDSNAQVWTVGTPAKYQREVGLFLTNTCIGKKVGSYKPVYQRTQLEYNEIDFPQVYINLLNDSVSKYLMPSYHYNVAIALLRDGKSKTGKSWLLKAVEREKIDARKLKVLQLKF